MLLSPEIYKKQGIWIVRIVQARGRVLSSLESAQCDKKRVGPPDSLTLFFWKVSNSWTGQSTRAGLNFPRNLNFSIVWNLYSWSALFGKKNTCWSEHYYPLYFDWWAAQPGPTINILEIRHRWTLVTLLELSSYFHNEFHNRITPIEIG